MMMSGFWFVIAVATLEALAGITYACEGKWLPAFIWTGYAVASYGLAFLAGR